MVDVSQLTHRARSLALAFVGIFVTEQPAAAWAASCVALLTHPDFYLY